MMLTLLHSCVAKMLVSSFKTQFKQNFLCSSFVFHRLQVAIQTRTQLWEGAPRRAKRAWTWSDGTTRTTTWTPRCGLRMQPKTFVFVSSIRKSVGGHPHNWNECSALASEQVGGVRSARIILSKASGRISELRYFFFSLPMALSSSSFSHARSQCGRHSFTHLVFPTESSTTLVR